MTVGPGPSPITGRGLQALASRAAGGVLLDIREDARQGRAYGDEPLFHYVNHSCAPNAHVNEAGQLVAARTLWAVEEVTIDYTQSCDFTEGFMCECGADDCRGWIEKEYDPANRVSPLVIVSGQVGAAVITGESKSVRVPEEVPCLNR